MNLSHPTIGQSPLLHALPEASGLTVLVTTAELPMYKVHMARIFSELRPATPTESELAQRLANTEWRLNRIARLEMGIFAAGQLKFADLFTEYDSDIQGLLLEQHIFQVSARPLKDLALQESRLRRYYAQDLAEYTKLKAQRLEQEEAESAAKVADAKPEIAIAATAAPQTQSAENGFVFSNAKNLEQNAPSVSHLNGTATRQAA